jgi:cell division protein ZapA (FtsZ GTPase activity inhibitor)
VNRALRSSFRGRTPSSAELDDLILVELAVRDRAGLDEERRPLPQPNTETDWTGNVRAMAAAEGWSIEMDAVDRAVRRLRQAQLLMTDRDPSDPGAAGCCARLTAAGEARAVARARDLLGESLFALPSQDPAFEGIGQVEVRFLGERLVIGCVDGEEEKAILHAHRFEVDTGEVLKAVTADLDHTRAMLMAGVLAHERIAELEADLTLVPASDRVVGLNHNAPDYVATVTALEHLIEVVRESNSYRESDPDDQDRRLAELEAGQRLIQSRWISVATLRAALWGTLGYLATKFIDVPIGPPTVGKLNAIEYAGTMFPRRVLETQCPLHSRPSGAVELSVATPN